MIKDNVVELEDDDEEGNPRRRKARIRNLKVRIVSLVDDGAVPKAYYKLVKNESGHMDLEMSDVKEDSDVDSSDAVIASDSESSIEMEELQSRVSELTSLVENMAENLSSNAESFGTLLETVNEIKDQMTSKEEESVVESEGDTDEGPQISVVESEQDDESIVTPEMLETLTELSAEMNEKYEAGDISDEEFDTFNSEIENLLSEVA